MKLNLAAGVVAILVGSVCLPVMAASKVTYSKDVAPILYENCLKCHRAGEVAPMSLESYAEARPWAKSIKEKVTSGAMPPWFADPAHGKFSNDASLNEDEIATIARWVDQGAPEGEASDLPPLPEFTEGWQLGEPDYIIDLPEVRVPAEGYDIFPNLSFTANIPEGRWVRAIEIRPSNRDVAHHIVVFMNGYGGGMGMNFDVLGVWSVGTAANVYPKGIGRRIEPKQQFIANMHYHPSGEAGVDNTRIGLYFGEGELEHELNAVLAGPFDLFIPAGAENHAESDTWYVPEDIKVVSFFPHMHFRGKSMTFTAVDPEGRKDTLLNVPNYDFNWQLFYYPEEPVSIAKGSRIDIDALYDNSENNPNNPDPTKNVHWGLASTDEMMFGVFEFYYDDGDGPDEQTKVGELGSSAAETEAYAAAMPEGEVYRVELNFGSMSVPSAVWLPAAGGEGEWFVSVQGMQVFLPVTDLTWDAEDFTANVSLRFGEMGGEFELTGTRTESGALRGLMSTGGDLPLMTLAFTGERVES